MSEGVLCANGDLCVISYHPSSHNTHTHTHTHTHARTHRPVAIALYDYDALGEEDTLTFDEGEVVEVYTHTTLIVTPLHRAPLHYI